MSSDNELLKYLPDIYNSQDVLDISKNDKTFAQFLNAFEKVLLGREDDVKIDKKNVIGLEEQIAQVYNCFDPFKAPDEFLSWLAGWTALSLRADLPKEQEKTFIANIISHYNKRGTKANLEALLKIFVQGEPEVVEMPSPRLGIGDKFQIGKSSYVGEISHFFKVRIVFPRNQRQLDKQQEDRYNRFLAIARFVIELEKPAHTHYQLEPIYEGTIELGKTKLGVDSFIGNKIDN